MQNVTHKTTTPIHKENRHSGGNRVMNNSQFAVSFPCLFDSIHWVLDQENANPTPEGWPEFIPIQFTEVAEE